VAKNIFAFQVKAPSKLILPPSNKKELLLVCMLLTAEPFSGIAIVIMLPA